MVYNKTKRFVAAMLLLAFSAPTTFAISSSNLENEVEQVQPSAYKSSMYLTGGVKLTNSDEPITLSLRDSDVKQVIRMFADKAGKNVIFHDSVSGKVTLDLVKMPINEAFNLVLQIAGLSYYEQTNTMIVMSKSSPDNANYSKQEMMVFPIKYVSAVKIANFLNKNVFSMKKPGLSAVDAATVNSATNELIVFGMPSDAEIVKKVIEQFDKEPFTKTFAVNHTTPAEMANMICNLLLPSRGIGSAEGSVTGGAASIGGSNSDLRLGEGIIACSTSVKSDSSTVAPFDVQNLSVAYFPQRGTITVMGGSEAQANMIENFIKTNDVKQPQALLEVSIVELNEQGSKDFQNQWTFSSKPWSFYFDGKTFSGGRQSGAFEQRTPGTMYNESYEFEYDKNGNIIKATPTQTATPWMFLQPSATYISWQMSYLIENRKARVLANPKIMITNGQESIIDLTQDYVEKVTSEYLTSSVTGTGTTGTAQRTYTIGNDLGIKVTLTPFISPEGYVTLNIKPEYSTVAGEIRGPGEVQGQTDIAGTLLSRRDLDLKNLRIKDGETLIIGGLIQETEQKTVSKIPFLGDLPLIGPIFRSTGTSKAKSELVIMITPKIINDGEGAIADTL